MHRKNFQLKKPLDNFAVPLEMFLTDMAKNSIRGYTGSYTGNGVSGKSVSLPFYPQLIIISPTVSLTTSDTTIAGNYIFTLSANAGASWVPEVGFRKDCVLTVKSNSMTLGSNAVVNAAGTDFTFFIVG